MPLMNTYEHQSSNLILYNLPNDYIFRINIFINALIINSDNINDILSL